MKPEIVITVGIPGSGKSTVVRDLVAQGYTRLNRDEIGGSLKLGSLFYQALERLYREGHRAFVLDNTYVNKEGRAVVFAYAKKLGLPVRCLRMDTTIEQAQFFAARRQIQKYGKLFTKADFVAHRDDPNMFPPGVQFDFARRLQEPSMDEGFTAIEHVPVKVELGLEYTNGAVMFDYDGTLRVTKSDLKFPRDPSEIAILSGRMEKLRELVEQKVLLLGASNQSGISKAPGDPKYVSEVQAQVCFDATNQMLGAHIEYLFAPDPAGVPETYWRKPMPGMGVWFIEKYKLDPAKVVFVGDWKTDKTFAERCGFQFQSAEQFFQGC